MKYIPAENITHLGIKKVLLNTLPTRAPYAKEVCESVQNSPLGQFPNRLNLAQGSLVVLNHSPQ